MIEVKSLPQLRFPEFSECWKYIKLGEVAHFSKGKNVSKDEVTEDGLNECIRYGELYTTYNETISEVFSKTNLSLDESVVSQANDVIIPASGETQLDIATASCVLREGIILGGDLNIIRTANSGVFLSYYLNNKGRYDIARLSQGSSVVHLYSKQLSRLKINFPALPEQQKIASFLTAVDDKITQLTKKKALLEQYKKGVMQRIFSQEIKFRDDEGGDYPEWEKKELKSVASFFSGGTPSSSNRSYYSGSIPFIGSGNISNTEVNQFITEEALRNSSAKMVKVGDLLYALYGATSGEVSVSKINGAINQAILCIRTHHNIEFLYQFLSTQKAKIISKYLQGGQGNLSAKIIKDLKISFPSIEEQTKIANFLSAIDHKITLVDSQIEKTTAFKKGLLQQMFV
tara:strand:+ start:11493 stop:12695 length:1203 start_codon:yes stop_codon:yes gene_type:complete